MKKLILMAAVALMALPAAAQMQEAFPSYIQVNGRAEKEITPDDLNIAGECLLHLCRRGKCHQRHRRN